MKRLTDIVISAGLLVVTGPLLVALAVGVWLDVGRPVFFRQLRPGRHGQLFNLIKFRSMRDGRTTSFGRFLRRWSLDELPQLVNVLRGDMSLVGPRPLLPEYLPLFTGREQLRHSVRPGITGWAQIHGRNLVSWDEKLEMDVWYVENRSARLDIRIFVETLWVVLSGRGLVANPDEQGLPALTDIREPNPAADEPV